MSDEGCDAGDGQDEGPTVTQQRKKILKEIEAAKKRLNSGNKNVKSIETENINKLRDKLKSLNASQDSEIEKESVFESGIKKYNEGVKIATVSKSELRRRKKDEKLNELRQHALSNLSNREDMRVVELMKIGIMIEPLNLEVKEIRADGSCLYSAIIDQLQILPGPDKHKCLTPKELRSIVSKEMLKFRIMYLPYLTGEDGHVISEEEYEKYCDSILNPKTWGGHLEISAMSHYFKRPIYVVQDTFINEIKHEGAIENTLKPLYISFHKHYYEFGNHYNSLRPCINSQNRYHEGC